jgi:hypothetical protein
MRTRRGSPPPGALLFLLTETRPVSAAYGGYAEGNRFLAACVLHFGNFPEASMAGLVGVGIYFLPSLIAVARRTHNVSAALVLFAAAAVVSRGNPV